MGYFLFLQAVACVTPLRSREGVEVREGQGA
jgi:hypothetical protein